MNNQRSIGEILERPVWAMNDLTAYLGVSRGWVYGMVYRGEIPHYKIGLYLRFRRDEILDWFRQQARGPAA